MIEPRWRSHTDRVMTAHPLGSQTALMPVTEPTQQAEDPLVGVASRRSSATGRGWIGSLTLMERKKLDQPEAYRIADVPPRPGSAAVTA